MFFLDGIARPYSQVVLPDEATSSANAAVAITLAAVTGKRHYLAMVLWSYSDTPTGGRLTVSGLDNSETLDIDIVAAGPGPVLLPPLAGKVGTAMVITLAAGGGTVVGKLNIMTATLPALYPF